MIRVGLLSLGCPKNLVDSEAILAGFRAAGFTLTDDLEAADAVVINSCAFLRSARKEARSSIASLRASGPPGRLLVLAGCLVPWLRARRKGRPRGIDLMVGPGEYGDLPELVAGRLGPAGAAARPWARVPATARHYAYLKIAEGCDNRCRYCLIPSLRGPLRSRPREEIIEESRRLARSGAWEQILVAQDTAAYGRDRHEPEGLEGLLAGLEEVEGLRWIRILYAHPGHITRRLLLRLSRSATILPYLDIPLQHVSSPALARMGRGVTRGEIEGLLASAREIVPAISLRTTLMAGFPGETREEFEELLDFVVRARFDHLGVFVYSPEPGTAACGDPGRVGGAEARRRREALMARQREISAAALARRRGERVAAVIEGKGEDGVSRLGRAWFQAPEIDGAAVFVDSPAAPAGRPLSGRIVGSSEYDVFVRVEEGPEG